MSIPTMTAPSIVATIVRWTSPKLLQAPAGAESPMATPMVTTRSTASTRAQTTPRRPHRDCVGAARSMTMPIKTERRIAATGAGWTLSRSGLACAAAAWPTPILMPTAGPTASTSVRRRPVLARRAVASLPAGQRVSAEAGRQVAEPLVRARTNPKQPVQAMGEAHNQAWASVETTGAPVRRAAREKRRNSRSCAPLARRFCQSSMLAVAIARRPQVPARRPSVFCP